MQDNEDLGALYDRPIYLEHSKLTILLCVRRLDSMPAFGMDEKVCPFLVFSFSQYAHFGQGKTVGPFECV